MAKKKSLRGRGGKGCVWLWGIVSEVAFYFFLYYVQYLLKVEANLWVSSLVLWALINISVFGCPVLGRHFKG